MKNESKTRKTAPKKTAPKKASPKSRSNIVTLRFTSDEKTNLKARAKKAELSVSSYIRSELFSDQWD